MTLADWGVVTLDMAIEEPTHPKLQLIKECELWADVCLTLQKNKEERPSDRIWILNHDGNFRVLREVAA